MPEKATEETVPEKVPEEPVDVDTVRDAQLFRVALATGLSAKEVLELHWAAQHRQRVGGIPRGVQAGALNERFWNQGGNTEGDE